MSSAATERIRPFLRSCRGRVSHLFNERKQSRFRRAASKGTPIRYRFSHGATISLYPKGQIAEILSIRPFEQFELSCFAAFLKPGMHVVDVGANIGLYSIIADRLVRPDGLVWAIEPSSETYARLLDNLALNSTVCVTPVMKALGEKEAEVLQLRCERSLSDAERYIEFSREAHAASSVEESADDLEAVEGTSVDHLMDELGNTRVDFMKIDVEGFEYWVLRGAKKVLQSNPNILILFECNAGGTARAGHRQEHIFDFLQQFGLQVFARDNPKRKWSDDRDAILAAGYLWACRHQRMLPDLH
jgi:FkbM family methyltransferase